MSVIWTFETVGAEKTRSETRSKRGPKPPHTASWWPSLQLVRFLSFLRWRSFSSPTRFLDIRVIYPHTCLEYCMFVVLRHPPLLLRTHQTIEKKDKHWKTRSPFFQEHASRLKLIERGSGVTETHAAFQNMINKSRRSYVVYSQFEQYFEVRFVGCMLAIRLDLVYLSLSVHIYICIYTHLEFEDYLLSHVDWLSLLQRNYSYTFHLTSSQQQKLRRFDAFRCN